MATAIRQPFAPLDGARLQTLTSLKNRQNAISNAPVKRKAAEVEVDDFENVDPAQFTKRSKGAGAENDFKDFFKPSSFTLTKAVSAPILPVVKDVLSTQFTKPQPPKARTLLQPKSPAARLNTSLSTSSLTAPAGRSPTRGSKRVGILSRRRTQRVDPPSFGSSSSAPFSLDAALKGTIPTYSGRFRTAPQDDLRQTEMKSSWFFDIHEDTPEQEMTNLLQHSTCTLDISSDEESERRARREQAEGRDKENIPPADDISQTTLARAARAAGSFDDMIIEKQRGPLLEMNAADYYAEGCDGSSVIIVPGDDEEAETVIDETEPAPLEAFNEEPEPEPQTSLTDIETVDIDELMGKEDPAEKAAVLQPIEGTGETFELWESGSSKDETEAPASPAPAFGCWR
ncbi:hypothetical protein QBC47DRAFT_426049 [Echria macrotheca]|uniref:Thymidylate kinase n=1 Tax=Echria macrotheca TaxID=438768 RepID=A0AAJ0F6U9_9PEZI|nr:hypothetical protein QBC47DRAFT_426049 [Echria macrotheca]